MRIILLSGGSGKRLWPLSNDARSKQFLKVLSNQENKLESMVQRVYNQLKNMNLHDRTSIATSKTQVEMIHNQIGTKINVIAEPSRRDTFPAIALAASYLYSEEQIAEDEVIAVLPVDPYVEDSFFEKVKDLEGIISESNADLALIGIEPTYPSEKYGYIVPIQENQKNYKVVSRFTEKPNESVAKELLEQKALWNSGVFAFRLGYIINLLQAKGYSTNYQDLIKTYDQFEKISFDYAVVENASNIVVTPYNGFWKDLGTWNTLTEEMATAKIGEGRVSGSSENTHMINELGIPVSVLGIKDAVVAASPDGILVASKEESPKIKELMAGHNAIPMYEERYWGSYKVLDYSNFLSHQVITRHVKINTGKHLSYQYHKYRKENWTVIQGEGILIIDEDIQVVRQGDVIQINENQKHAVKAIKALEIIEVQQGINLNEEDINRIESKWEKIEEKCFSRITN
ncbi:sugar phosphate nucleotidyltransferase [Priestia aryabhattai]|uniref:sugar phosphate nucleotidyltransferase n=1 Tax=Priestia aryabhattai TaxID=412384 RepID=UPI001C8EB30F|nr:sugar phosphate nucleotidyltransferase [Priestia aryabhattai]MBX9987791.1 cupin domain-containing protein [Priestia aryabhattai]